MHYNYPQQEPWLMAIQVVDCVGIRKPEFQPIAVQQLERLGFVKVDGHVGIYCIERTNEDGAPFRSDL
jgi:hypothetical protein